MSTQPTPTTDTTDAPTFHEIAARLECDAAELRLFVEHHPNPTVPVVLGWAKASPEHEDAVERFLDARLQRRRDRVDELGDRIDEAAANGDGRLGFTEAGQ
jgi:hypothetical protein